MIVNYILVWADSRPTGMTAVR